MICGPCKDGDHESCPEMARQSAIRAKERTVARPTPLLTRMMLATGQVCDCAHKLIPWRPGIPGSESLAAGQQ